MWKYLEGITEADIAVEVKGKNFEELLENIISAFFEISTSQNSKSVKMPQIRQIILEGKSEKDFVIALIDELIFLKDTKGLAFPKGKFNKCKSGYKAVLLGGPIGEYGQGIDVKALSYHHLEVEKTSKGWRAVLVFDV